ncbi:linear amide C-N hydrolase [Bombilactobacillus bombi]|uniref:linear amide C-N hydrolase n=1 Tax=Bombilactobacillus bombi TaxID=1303590 RepID=UPI000E57EBBE|nr:linear amide C-N hydrolase [Bombilactobacillus bombi]AXX64074.1 linear amide C-N hydrolase [Bombilactobacillus bombi]
MCTSISIQATNQDVFWGRTMDFTFDPFKASVDSKITAYPKGYKLKGLHQSWQTKFAFAGINVNNSLFFNDGINSAGIVGDAQYLEEASWTTLEDLKKRSLKPIIGEEVIAYVLSNFGSIAEIKKAFSNFGQIKTNYPDWDHADTGIPTPIPMHYTFSDNFGNSIVLEPVDKGAFKIYDSIGVMTNSPQYSWHLDNLRNYLYLTNHNRGHHQLTANLDIKQIESGSGLLGLPGDYTAPSRFIRSTFLSKFLAPFERQQGITQLYNVFKSVMIPQGIEHVNDHSETCDYTGYWSGYDVDQRTIYIQPEDCPTMTKFSLSENITEKITQPISHTFKVNE